MDKLFYAGKAEGVKLLLEEVFHRLYVVVGDGFYLLDALCVSSREVLVDGAEGGKQGVVYLRQLGERYLAEGDEILNLHAHAVADESIF